MENENEVVIAEDGAYRVVQRPNYVVGSKYKVCYVIQIYFAANNGSTAWRDMYGPYLKKPTVMEHFNRTVQWARERAAEKK